MACVLTVQGLRRRLRLGATAILVSWSAFAVPAFLLGGQFHRHYWIILMFPLGTIAGASLATIDRALVRVAFVVLLLVGPVLMTVAAASLPREDVPIATSADPRLLLDERVAAWFDDHSGPGDDVYAMCWSAGLYGNVGTDPPFPYLWADNMHQISGAVPALRAMFAAPDPPTYVATYQPAIACDGSGAVASLVAARYERVAVVDGIGIYRWTGR